jgi:hypothetical protein
MKNLAHTENINTSLTNLNTVKLVAVYKKNVPSYDNIDSVETGLPNNILRGFSPPANYTDRATAAYRRS